jgi:hypothetical protein
MPESLIADFSWGEGNPEGSIILGNGIIKANKIIEEYISTDPFEADFSWGEQGCCCSGSPSPEPYADFDFEVDVIFGDVQLFNMSVGDTSYKIEWGDGNITEGTGVWTYFVHDYTSPAGQTFEIILTINGGMSSMTQYAVFPPLPPP